MHASTRHRISGNRSRHAVVNASTSRSKSWLDHGAVIDFHFCTLLLSSRRRGALTSLASACCVVLWCKLFPRFRAATPRKSNTQETAQRDVHVKVRPHMICFPFLISRLRHARLVIQNHNNAARTPYMVFCPISSAATSALQLSFLSVRLIRCGGTLYRLLEIVLQCQRSCTSYAQASTRGVSGLMTCEAMVLQRLTLPDTSSNFQR